MPSWNTPYQSAPIKGCNPDTVFDMPHYYDCRPYQHDRYTFTNLDSGEQTTQEAMHAIRPVRELAGVSKWTEQLDWHLEESVHALLHGDLFRARILARILNLTIDPAK